MISPLPFAGKWLKLEQPLHLLSHRMTLFSQSAFDVHGKPINTTNYNILPQLCLRYILIWEIQFRDTSFCVIIMLIKLGHEILCICLMCPNIYINRLH